MSERQIRFRTPAMGAQGWTRWFHADELASAARLMTMEIMAIEVVETVTVAEFRRQFPDIPIPAEPGR